MVRFQSKNAQNLVGYDVSDVLTDLELEKAKDLNLKINKVDNKKTEIEFISSPL